MDATERLRASVNKLGKSRLKRRYKGDLRAELIQHSQELRESGMTVDDIANALDISPMTIIKFLNEQLPIKPKPIKVLNDETVNSELLELTGPGGITIRCTIDQCVRIMKEISNCLA